MPDQLVSIVLPVHNQADHVAAIVDSYGKALAELPRDYELILVPNACRDESVAICRRLAAEDDHVRVVELQLGGWGRAVRAGLADARGGILCYTNSARTTAQMLTLALLVAHTYPEVVVKAQRTIRDNRLRRIGSLFYNLECRLLFGLATWDINGTPKVFPRTHRSLLALQRDDDLIDAEFVMTCRREGYPIVEIPSTVSVRHSGRSTTGFGSAWRMYRGAYQLSRERGRR
ncbi:MAG: glycosyl transferase [Solirubrobacterales bacterium]|nr:glycosyl transferase [Solirubrobacterales bacterium]